MVEGLEALLWVVIGCMAIGIGIACIRYLKIFMAINQDFELSTWILSELSTEQVKQITLKLQHRRFSS